jgi:hypothetical protein
MVDIAIHRCTLRIVRHGGWGWGPEPPKLLQAAIRALPELLARELGKLWRDDVELELAAPISLRVSLSLSELLAVANEDVEAEASPLLQTLGDRIGLAARKAFVGEPGLAAASPEVETEPRAGPETSFSPPDEPGGKVLAALLLWYRAGVLSRRLAAFSAAALEAWLDQLVRSAGVSDQGSNDAVDAKLERREPSGPLFGGPARLAGAAVIESLVGDSARPFRNGRSDRAGLVRRRLLVVTEVIAQLGLSRCTPAVLAALDRALPFERSGEPESNVSSRTLLLANSGSVTSASVTDQSEPATATGPAGARSDHQEETSASVADLLPRRASEQSLRTSETLEQWNPATSSGHVAKQINLASAESPSITAADPDISSPRPQSPLMPPPRSETYSLRLQPQIARPSIQGGASEPSRPGRTRQIALPFLLLGPLSRVGYLKALAATMEAANALPALTLFAAALAYKVLLPPARGWRRAPDSIAAATAFAGLSEAAAEPALVQLAMQLADQLSPLDAVLSGALIGGHNQQQPLLLLQVGAEVESGFILADVEGTFPIQWAANASELRQTLVELDSSLVLVPEWSAETKLLRWLDEEGFHFITDAVPTRGEQWRALRRSPEERWWTNEAVRSDAALISAARALPEAAEEAATLWEALTVRRPSIPLAADARLDRHLALAASTALGTIAWELWRDHEPTTPQLALERFADFEARVTPGRDVVRVSLPLGKRFQDLRDHGLLDDVVDVPWFNGRTVVFACD